MKKIYLLMNSTKLAWFLKKLPSYFINTVVNARVIFLKKKSGLGSSVCLTCVMAPWPCREVSSAGIGSAQASSMLGNFFCLKNQQYINSISKTSDSLCHTAFKIQCSSSLPFSTTMHHSCISWSTFVNNNKCVKVWSKVNY